MVILSFVGVMSRMHQQNCSYFIESIEEESSSDEDGEAGMEE